MKRCIAITIVILWIGCPLIAQKKKAPPRRATPSKSQITVAQAASAEEQELVAVERRILDAIRDRDSKELEPWIAEDFSYIDAKERQMNREQFLHSVKSFPQDIEWLSAEGLRVRVLGNVAIVTGVQQERIAPGEAGTISKADSESLTGQTAFTDVFRRRGGDWELVLVYAVELPAKPATATPSATPK
jgi:hypothetical protein